jgi:ABC-type hemin transport system ATPase subunit
MTGHPYRPMVPGHGHPDWCAGGHRCNLGEHRAHPVSLHADTGVIVLTRVRAADGAEHVEIRTRITLARGEMQARAHLARILTQLDALLRHLVRLPR